jgi:mannose-1-phosphate guanylyltransferase/mannose-6-phosphate isomerase
VDAFVEKPDLETARSYVADGYLWNSGMFCFDAGLFLSECEVCAPEVVRAFEQPMEEAYNATPALSIDYGVMEKTRRAAVVPLESDWSDVGNFDAVYAALPKNGDGNAVRCEHIGIDSSGNLIIADSLVATVGVHDIAIVETKDAILVAARDEAQRVGEIVKALRDRGDTRALFHTQVHRPWGSYTNLEEGRSYKIKRVTVPPKRRLSLQMHHHRSEHWVVVTGCAEVTIGDKTFLVRNGESTFVPAGTVHRLANPGILPLELIEVQIGEYTGEDDIVRFEDDFDRS